MKFVPRRYPVPDHLPCASTSAVGTNHSPVSPTNVVVAGRVSSAVVLVEDDCWLLGFCPVDVPEDPVCAIAAGAVAVRVSASTEPTSTCLDIVGRLQSR